MYFPYLYGRQAELNGITDLADGLGSPQMVFPLIEPVEPAAKLAAALDALKLEKASAYVIVNPSLGKLANSAAAASWVNEMGDRLEDASLVHPTLKETASTTLADVQAFALSHPSQRIGIVLTTSRIDPAALADALSATDYVVFFLPSATATNYVAALGADRTVDVSDNFRTEARNKDYSGEEWLGNNHTSWVAGSRKGFSDFTVLPGTFTSGGGPVGAIAIHLSFETGSDLYVQHFISDTNEQTDPQATKFREVLDDIHAQRTSTPARFRSSPGLTAYETQRTSGKFTNLSGNKRQQISHHIYTVAKHLGV